MPARAAQRKLALFDLDHTLINADTNSLWIAHLGELGLLDSHVHLRHLAGLDAKYHAGTLGMEDFLSQHLFHLAGQNRNALAEIRQNFHEAKGRELIGPKARAAVKAHQSAGDLCILVTATCSFVTSTAALDLGFDHIIGTVAEVSPDGFFTGKSLGTPSYREGKISRVDDYLRDRGESRSDFSEVWFYSDSRNDLPLLLLASHPVAVDPDPSLLQAATERGWPIESFRP